MFGSLSEALTRSMWCERLDEARWPGSRGQAGQSAPLRTNLGKVGHSVVFEPHNQNEDICMDCAGCTDQLRLKFCSLFEPVKDRCLYELILLITICSASSSLMPCEGWHCDSFPVLFSV